MDVNILQLNLRVCPLTRQSLINLNFTLPKYRSNVAKTESPSWRRQIKRRLLRCENWARWSQVKLHASEFKTTLQWAAASCYKNYSPTLSAWLSFAEPPPRICWRYCMCSCALKESKLLPRGRKMKRRLSVLYLYKCREWQTELTLLWFKWRDGFSEREMPFNPYGVLLRIGPWQRWHLHSHLPPLLLQRCR